MTKEILFKAALESLDVRKVMERRYDMHGLPVAVSSDSGMILEAVEGLLGYFRREETPSPKMTFYLMKEDPARFSYHEPFLNEGTVLFDSREDDEHGFSSLLETRLVYRTWNRAFMADFGSRGCFFLDTTEGLGLGFVPEPEAVHPAILSNFMFLIGLSEMCRARDYFLIHAAAVTEDGKGVLVPALSGSGKTTLCVSLLHGGFKYLSDDRPFLRSIDGGYEILSFPEDIDVTENTISLFPELRELDPSVLRTGLRKRKFSVESVYPGITRDRTTPRVLLFPRVVDEKRSRLRGISKTEAVARLLPHSLLVMDPDVAAKQFHMLCGMVETMDCYELDYGRDVLEVHRLVRDLLQ